MKEADVPVGAHGAQKLHQGTWTLGENKAQQSLILSLRAGATHHVSNVLFGQVVVGQVQSLEAMLAQVSSNFLTLQGFGGGEAYKHMGHGTVIHSVIELRDLSGRNARTKSRQRAEQLTKLLEASSLLGDGHCKQAFPMLTDFGALGDKAQAVKIHVGTT